MDKNMGVHTEIIKKQQVQVRRALEKVLVSKIPVERYRIELKLTLQIRCNFNIKQKERLRNAVVKYKLSAKKHSGFQDSRN